MNTLDRTSAMVQCPTTSEISTFKIATECYWTSPKAKQNEKMKSTKVN